MTETAPAGPHAEAPAARFITDHPGQPPVYVLVGTVLGELGTGDDATIELLVAPGARRVFDPVFLPMLQFFQTARTEQQAREWLEWAGAPDDGLKDMVDTGLVVKVDTASPWKAAASFKGLRIVSQCVPGEPDPSQPSLIAVHRDADSPTAYYVHADLEHVLWGLPRPLDIPKAIRQRQITQQSREPRDVIARRVVTNMPYLIQHGLARLEWERAPQPR